MSRFPWLRCLILWAAGSLLCIPVLQGQTHLGDYFIRTQSEATNFSYTHIEGVLSISGQDITDLTPLSGLRTVWGLQIVNTSQLDSLKGLDSVRIVPPRSGTSRLVINENTNLSSLRSLENITQVDELVIAGNTRLSSMQGLENLRDTIAVRIRIAQSPFTDLAALRNIRKAGELELEYNANLISLKGLENIVELDKLRLFRNETLQTDTLPALQRLLGPLELIQNDALEGLYFPLLEEVAGIHIEDSPAMTTVAGFPSLTRMGTDGELLLIDNPQLQEVDGLVGLQGPVRQLVIKDNEVLQQIDGLKGLTGVGGVLQIENNAQLLHLNGLSGLRTARTVELFFLPEITEVDSLDGLAVQSGIEITRLNQLKSIKGFGQTRELFEIVLRENPLLSELEGFRGLQSLRKLELYQNPLIDSLNGFSTLWGPLYTLTIENCEGLRDLQGLEGIQTLDILTLEDNPALRNLKGLDNVSIILAIFLKRNARLINLEGLGSLYFTERLELRENAQLQNLDGLSGLNEFYRLFIHENPALQDIDALSRVGKAPWLIEIVNNDQLKQIDGLVNLPDIYDWNSFNGKLLIRDNDRLTHLDGLAGLKGMLNSRLVITDNVSLTNIEGLGGITGIFPQLTLTDNPELEDCCILFPLVERQKEDLERIEIRRNKHFCDTDEILRIGPCGSPGYDGPLPSELPPGLLFPNPTTSESYLYYEVEEETRFQLTLYDATGRQITRQWEQILEPGTGRLTFDFRSLSPGLYYYHIFAPEEGPVGKIVIQ